MRTARDRRIDAMKLSRSHAFGQAADFAEAAALSASSPEAAAALRDLAVLLRKQGLANR